MKLVFAHDHKIRIYNNQFYTTGGFSDEVTKRYTNVFGNMTLICRATVVQSNEGLVRIDNEFVKIYPLMVNKAYPSKAVLENIKNEIKDADRVIVRLPSLLGVYTAIIAFRLNVPLCVEVVGSALGSYWYKNSIGKVTALPLELINKYIVKRAAYVLYVSEKYLQKEYPSSGKNIGCSDVVLEKRNESILANRLNKIETMPNEKNIVIGTLAQVDQKYKGQDTVIRAIAELRKLGYTIEYRLAGSGKHEYLNQIADTEGVADCIKYCGQIKHEFINEWLDELDIYIQPSLTEGMPRSVIEALYRGCPTIVSSAGGMYELLTEEYRFLKGNTDGIVNILSKVSQEKLKKMATQNYDFSSKFDYDKLNEKRHNFYERFRDDKENY